MSRFGQLLRQVLIVLGAALAIMMLSAGSASAFDPDAPGRSPVNSAVCSSSTGNALSGNPADSNWLSINRWGDVSDDFHDRLDADFFNDIFAKIQRRMIFSTMLSAGNSMWELSASLTGFATRFCIIDSLGKDADGLTKTLGDALFSSGLIAGIVALSILVVLWRHMRQKGKWTAMLRPLIVVGIIGMFTIGASNSTSNQPGVGSPWWFASQIEKTVSNVAAAPAAALSKATDSVSSISSPTNMGSTSCVNFVRNLNTHYKQEFGGGIDQLSITVPQTMSKMWENSGLAVWIQSQYGSENPYGVKVFCYTLDSRLGSPIGQPGDPVSSGSRIGILHPEMDSLLAGSWAFNWENDSLLEDAATVGLAACRYTDATKWTVEPGWAQMESGGTSGGGGTVDGNKAGKITPDDCNKFFTGLSDRNVDTYGEMHMAYADDPAFIADSTREALKQDPNAKAAGNFLLNWHGNSNNSAFALAAVFDLAALIMLVVFGGISIGIIIAKVMMVVMIALVLLVAVMSLWPGSGTSRLAQYAKTYAGITLFVFGLSVLFSLIALITGYLSQASTTLFEQGSLLSILWFGFAPVTAILVLHMLIKHVLKMPSPFKLSGALAWGAAIGGIGAGVGAGLDRMAGQAKNRTRQTIAGSRLNPIRNGRSGDAPRKDSTGGNDQRMTAIPKVGVGALAGAAGAAAGAAGTGGSGDPGAPNMSKSGAAGSGAAGAGGTGGDPPADPAGAVVAGAGAAAGGGSDDAPKKKSDTARVAGALIGAGARVVGLGSKKDDPDAVPRASKEVKKDSVKGQHLESLSGARREQRAELARMRAAGDGSALDKLIMRKSSVVAAAAYGSGRVLDTRPGRRARFAAARIGTSAVAERSRHALTWAKEHKTKTALGALGALTLAPIALAAAPLAAGVAATGVGMAASAVGTVFGASAAAGSALSLLAVRKAAGAAKRHRNSETARDRRQRRLDLHEQAIKGVRVPTSQTAQEGTAAPAGSDPAVDPTSGEAPTSGAEQQMGSERQPEPIGPLQGPEEPPPVLQYGQSVPDIQPQSELGPRIPYGSRQGDNERREKAPQLENAGKDQAGTPAVAPSDGRGQASPAPKPPGPTAPVTASPAQRPRTTPQKPQAAQESPSTTPRTPASPRVPGAKITPPVGNPGVSTGPGGAGTAEKGATNLAPPPRSDRQVNRTVAPVPPDAQIRVGGNTSAAPTQAVPSSTAGGQTPQPGGDGRSGSSGRHASADERPIAPPRDSTAPAAQPETAAPTDPQEGR
ncbi:MAG: hypothetical protein WKF57_03610 [Nakamurella sp.]